MYVKSRAQTVAQMGRSADIRLITLRIADLKD